MTALAFCALLLNLAVFGLHALAPLRLARGQEESRRTWALSALPMLLAASVLTVATVTRRPDEAIAWGLADPLHGSLPSRWISVAMVALLLADLLLAFGWRRFEPAAWRLMAAFGGLGAAAQTLGSELLRNGSAPLPATWALVTAALLRLPLTFAAGELALGPPRIWTPLAGPALWCAAQLWAPEMWSGLGAVRWTLGAATLLLLLARAAPPALRRTFGIAGLLLATVALVRSAEVGRILGGKEILPDVLLAP